MRWTPEARAKQRELIYKNKPWLKSTGAKTLEGKNRSKMNAYKTGMSAMMKLYYEAGRLRKEAMQEWVEFN